MADSDKDIVITPNTGNTTKPKIEFTGADNSVKYLQVNDDGSLTFNDTITATSGSVANGNQNLVTGTAVFGYISARNFISNNSNITVGNNIGLAGASGNSLRITTAQAASNGAILSFVGSDNNSISNLTIPSGDGTISTSDTQLTTEEVQDIVAAMIVGGTNISAAYNDSGGLLTLAVNGHRTVTAGGNTLGATETLALTAGSNVTISESGGAVTIASTDTNTDTNTQNVFTSSFVDSSNDTILRLTKSGASSGTQDIKFVAGSNVTLTPSGTNLTIASTDTNTQLSLLDEDNFASNSATAAASQQSIKSYVDTSVSNLVASAPSALDTLNELAAALGDDASFSTTTATSLGNRLRIDVSNQGLNSTQQSNALTNLGITATLAEINILDDGLATGDIPALATSKITSGTFADARIAQSNVTQHQSALSITESQISDLQFKLLPEVLFNDTNFGFSLLIQTGTTNAAPTTGTLDNATFNIGLGSNVFSSLTSGTRNVAVGHEAGRNLTTSARNTLLGAEAGHDITTGGNNVAIGDLAGDKITTGSQNTLIGAESGGNITTTSYSIGLGNKALLGSTGTANIGIGYQSLNHTSHSGSYNVAIGHQAAHNATGANGNNIGIGKSSLYNVTGGYNYAIGDESGQGITSGSSNIAIGSKSLGGSGTVVTNAHNIAIGNNALKTGGTLSGGLNTAFGYATGSSLTTGQGNLLLGFTAGNNITTGSENIVIGAADVPSATGNHQLSISDNGNGSVVWITGDSSGHVSLGNYEFNADQTVGSGQDNYVLRYDHSTGQIGLEAAGAGGENNQNAFSNVAVSGQTTVAADSATDTLTLAAGANVTLTTNASNDTVTIAATDTNTNTQLSTEQVQDIVGGMLVGTETRIGVSYDDTNGRINFVVDDMTTDTNTFRTVTAGGNTLGSSETLAFTAGSNVTITESGGSVTIASTDTNTNTTYSAGSGIALSGTTFSVAGGTGLSQTSSGLALSHLGIESLSDPNADRILIWDDSAGAIAFATPNSNISIDGTNINTTNTQLSTEQVQDIVGAMLVGTETRIGVTYDDTNGRINFVVDDMTANTQLTLLDQDNMSSNSATAAASQQSIKAYVDAEIAGLVDSSPSALNTLNELAAALGDDASFSTTTATSLGNRLRVDVNNQGLNSTQQGNALTNLGITASLAEINILDGGLAASNITEISNLTAAEGEQLENIGSTTISATQWGYLGGLTAAKVIDWSVSQTFDDIHPNNQHSAGTNLTLSGTTLNVDDAFLVNNANDTTTGTITAAGFTTAGIVDGVNFKINGGQGSDGQVLTSTGSGVAWEDAASGGDSNAGGVNGSAGAPTFSFASDTNTGMYRLTGDTLAFSVGGSNAMYMQPSKVEANKRFEIIAGSNSAPGLSLAGDDNTGIYRYAENQIGFTTDGTAQLLIKDGAIEPVTDNDIDLGTSSLKFKNSYFGLVDAENFKVNGGQGNDGQILTSTGSGVAWENAAVGGIASLAADDTPQLGGDLDVNGNSIVSTSNTAINITPNGTGDIQLNADTIRVGDSNADVTIAPNISSTTAKLQFQSDGDTLLRTASGTGNMYLNANSLMSMQATTFRFGTSGGNPTLTTLGTSDLTLNTNSGTNSGSIVIADGANSDISITPNGTGQVNLGNFQFDVDQTVGSGQDNYVLTYDHANTQISLEAAGGGGASDIGALDDVLMDATNFTNSLLIQTNSDTSAPTTGTLSSANENIGIGRDVFKVLTSGSQNVSMGSYTLDAVTTGSNNTIIGHNAGTRIEDDSENTYIGQGAGANSIGSFNVALGSSTMTGSSSTLHTGSHNVALGRGAMTKVQGDAAGNVAV